MWGAIPQTSAQEWNNLRDVFTIESWFYWDGPLTNPFDYDLEHEYKPIIGRHPGQSVHNAWAHFHVEYVWFPTLGAVVLAFSGCGCDRLPPQFGGDSTPAHCDLGYVLRSDQGIRGPVTYLRPKEWHHIAYIVDGDGTNSMTTRTAALVVDGVLVDNITWPLTPNCHNRPIPWQAPPDFGAFNEIALGYLQNDDISAQGSSGRIDEVRIWNVPRTPQQVAKWYTSALSGTESGLVAYYNFNEGPQNGVQTFKNKVQLSKTPCGEPIGTARPTNTNRNVWSSSTGLSLFSNVDVKSSLVGDSWNPVRFELFGLEMTNSSIDFFISEVSSQLYQLIISGWAKIYDPRSHSNLNVNFFPQNVFRQLEISVACDLTSSGVCRNIGSGDLYIKYYGSAPSIPGTRSTVFFHVAPACNAELDACGVCGGDNSTCQCTSYHQFGVNRMSYTLFNYSVAQMPALIDMIQSTLNSSIANQPGNANFEERVTNLYETGNFHYGCLDQYYCLLQEFKAELEAHSA
eukprot:TRINITY_DN744_c0_g1_i1.p1 TRINITY_DN744_c0_g1~~TRINITY_DN744_c0_g1_i1.p1  ORF type:complete len:568 (-),score=107.06 TRINITY_DN744_c0_g1_i1:81-1622(-)